MNTKRFDCFYENHIGIGFRWMRWNLGVMLSASIPFVTFTIYLGKNQ